MNDCLYDYWVASMQNGYIGNLVRITDDVGGAKSLYEYITYHKNGGNTRKIMLTDAMKDYMAACWKNTDDIERDYYKMLGKNIVYVNHNDKDFPDRLRNIPSPPYGLFVKGELPDEKKKSIAIVGSRECSEYGRNCAEYFGDRLSREGIQIISGMAWGIDGISQMAAVKAGGKSYGILGCGVDVIYPVKNAGLYNMLCKDGNGVISEYAPGTKAASRLFPPRNRIIAGLCDLLLVVEARAKSGTFITVRLAMEQGKSIMAVPGRITDELSRGCLMLTKEGAAPAISIDSVLRELGVDPKDDEAYRQCELELDVPDDLCRRIIGNISYDPISADELSDLCKMSINDVLINLSKLELKGYIKEIAQGKFVINS